MADYKKKDEHKNKPHLPHFPDEAKKEQADKDDPTPDSEENYQYYPGVAYPENSDDENLNNETDGEDPEKKGPESL